MYEGIADEDINIGADNDYYKQFTPPSSTDGSSDGIAVVDFKAHQSLSEKAEESLYNGAMNGHAHTSTDHYDNVTANASGTHLVQHNGHVVVNGAGKDLSDNSTMPIYTIGGPGRTLFHTSYANDEYRKSREKLAKTRERKAKKIAASGWKKSNDIEGHKGLMEMDELLNYVGEKNSNPENTNTQQQKKKLRKKLSASSKQKAVCAGAAVSDVPTVPSVPVFNGGWTSQNSLSFSGDSDIEDRANQQRRPSNSATKHGAAAVRNGDKTSYIITGPPQPRNHFQTIDNDLEGEFKEVHRKKKINHKQTTGLHDKTRSSNAFNPRTTPDSQKTVSHRNTSASVTKGVDSSSASGYNPKVPPCPSPELVNVDFSLNAFPALESQCMDRFAAEEGKVAKAFNHSGLCNDSKDNFMQPTHTSSWAKIAAKPITSKPAPIEKAGHVDLTARNSTITDVPPSTVTSSNVVSSTEIVSNPDTTSTTAPPSRQRNNSHPAAVEDAMTRSASSVSIEFGTVTCSSDVKADRQVCDILSQSFTEGQNIFKCNQSRSTSRSSKNSSAMLDHTARQARVGKAKGVEFLDHHPGLKNKTFNISFGFDEEDKTIAQTNSAMTMSSSCYKPASKNPKTKAAVPCIAPPPSPAQSKDTSPILDQTMHQTSANDNTMCSESGAVEGADSESHKPFTPTTLSSGVDILPLIMCPNSKPIPSNPAAYKSDGFNVVATVRMLQKSWNAAHASLANKKSGTKYYKSDEDRPAVVSA